MSDNGDSRLAAVEEHASAAISEIRQVLVELAALAATRDHGVGKEVLRPAQRLVQGVAGMAEVAVDPLAQFVARQRALADQMAAWAELQHQFADSMAAWADIQRDLANAVGLWLAPVGGAAQLTTRVLHELAKERDAAVAGNADLPARRGARKPAAKNAARPRQK